MRPRESSHVRQPQPATLREVVEGLGAVLAMGLAGLTPFLRGRRNRWGLTAEAARAPRPGDEWIAEPRWSWTHAIEIEAPAERVWPWVAQLGADRAGFYSYRWLENLVGCDIELVREIHPEWALAVGDGLLLHPKIPPLGIVSLCPGASLVAFAPADPKAVASGAPWAAASWAFIVEALGERRCRVVSRFRVAHSGELVMRLSQGPWLLEPTGFVMDRGMLRGLRALAIEAEGFTAPRTRRDASPMR